jgi:hypothetical protein
VHFSFKCHDKWTLLKKSIKIVEVFAGKELITIEFKFELYISIQSGEEPSSSKIVLIFLDIDSLNTKPWDKAKLVTTI